MLLRAAPLRAVTRAAPRHVRALHVENEVNNVFPGGSNNTLGFKLRFLAYSVAGLGLPFFASWYAQRKVENGGAY